MKKTAFEFTPVRHDVADRAFQAYDFGDSAKVESADGWESDSSRDVSRIVYLDDGENETFRVSFHVLFNPEDSTSIEDVYALVLNNGGQIGNFPVQIESFNQESAGLSIAQ